jgi:hypothetical protein
MIGIVIPCASGCRYRNNAKQDIASNRRTDMPFSLLLAIPEAISGVDACRSSENMVIALKRGRANARKSD